MRTPISYYGGKTKMLPYIRPLIPHHSVYTEVFAGGLAVLFDKPKVKIEVINDRMHLVTNFYRVLKDPNKFADIEKLIDRTLYSRLDNITANNFLKKITKSTDIELAWAFWFKSNFSYMNKLNGGLKFNTDQCTNPPQVLRNKKREFTMELQRRIEDIFIEDLDAIEVLTMRNVKSAFHYQDPPYPGADQGHYKGYSWEEFNELLKWNQNECKGRFLLSNFNSELLQEYIDRNHWNKMEISFNLPKQRKSGSKKVEVLVWNYSNHINPNFQQKISFHE